MPCNPVRARGVPGVATASRITGESGSPIDEWLISPGPVVTPPPLEIANPATEGT